MVMLMFFSLPKPQLYSISDECDETQQQHRHSLIVHRLCNYSIQQHMWPFRLLTVQVLDILPCDAVFVYKLRSSHVRVSEAAPDAAGHISSH